MANTITSTIVLKVSGKEVENSFNGLSKTVKDFEKELKKLTPGTEEFMKKIGRVLYQKILVGTRIGTKL